MEPLPLAGVTGVQLAPCAKSGRRARRLPRDCSGRQLLEPRELASALNVSLDYVYAHAADLGVMRLGDGPKARLRFDLHTAQAALRARKQPPAAAPSRR